MYSGYKSYVAVRRASGSYLPRGRPSVCVSSIVLSTPFYFVSTPDGREIRVKFYLPNLPNGLLSAYNGLHGLSMFGSEGCVSGATTYVPRD